ncbi:C39 family peptidase [Patescibacteria group bacterium]|nr:C39 family peptidase [Patescibacteria group bacterium]MBU1673096.1 C39 family peptidase [Patescibacteria group bacterium]MBU1963377.1 C39 family peptidase [Patescibacteria group bacterium]
MNFKNLLTLVALVAAFFLTSCDEVDCWGPQVPFFSQVDPAWSGNKMGGSSCTIGSSGCLMTCFTMALNYYGFRLNPADFNLWLESNGGYTSGCLFASTDKISEFTNGSVTASQAYHSDIAGLVDAGYPIAARFGGSGDGQHWVLIVGRSGDKYFVLDPLGYEGDEGILLHDYGNPSKYYVIKGHDADNSVYKQASQRHGGKSYVGTIQHKDIFGDHGVHWYHGEWRSDGDDIFVQNRTGGALNDYSGIVYDALGGARKAYWIHTGFWEDGAGNGWTELGGPHSWLGAPITDEYWNGYDEHGNPQARQDFKHGYLWWSGEYITHNHYPYATPGWHVSAGWDKVKSYAFAEAYERNGARNDMGEAQNTVHSWGDVEVQNFNQGSYWDCALIYSPEKSNAYLIRTGFWGTYSQDGGPDKFGYPCEDEYEVSGVARQNFQKATFYWYGYTDIKMKPSNQQSCGYRESMSTPDEESTDNGECQFKGELVEAPAWIYNDYHSSTGSISISVDPGLLLWIGCDEAECLEPETGYLEITECDNGWNICYWWINDDC